MRASCKDCGKEYTDVYYNWCTPCQIRNLKDNFKYWTSGNKQIDDFIQEKQLKINYPLDKLLEWIPYNQFNNIKEISKNEFSIIYSAKCEDGVLYYDFNKYEMIRKLNVDVTLKCFYDSRKNTMEFLNEVLLSVLCNIIKLIFLLNNFIFL
jgi:hypothetical protein